MHRNFRYAEEPALGTFRPMGDENKKAMGRPVKPVEDPEASPVAVLRTKRGWSQQDLAEAVGIHRNTVGRIERGERKGIKLEVFEKIASALGCPVWQVVPGVFSSEQRQILEAFDQATPELKSVMRSVVDAVKKGS